MRVGHVLVGLGAWVAFHATVIGAASAPAPDGSGRPPRYVVSYFVSAGDDANAQTPQEGFPDRHVLPHPWHWRVFDPGTRRDTLFLTLPAFPTRVRWNPDYQWVQYVLDGRIEQAPWRLGAGARVQAHLPPDGGLCDFWSDDSGRWHVITQREDERWLSNGTVRYVSFATRWDQEDDGRWRAAATDSGGDTFGGCLESVRLEGERRPPVIMLDALLDSMLIGHHPYSTLRTLEPGEDRNTQSWVWVPFSSDTTIGLEMGEGFGDSDHAMEPVVWVDRKQGGRRVTVYDRGDSHDDAFGQVMLGKRDGFVLIEAEYSGAFPAVADMRTGRVVFRVSRPSARAVWVPAPR